MNLSNNCFSLFSKRSVKKFKDLLKELVCSTSKKSIRKKSSKSLPVQKTKNMIFNFSKNSQFSTDIQLNGEAIETVTDTKLLGTVVTDKLDWNKNTDCIVKEANKRMSFLHKTSKFTTNRNDLKKIYILQVRSKLEQSAVVVKSAKTNWKEFRSLLSESFWGPNTLTIVMHWRN